MNMSHETGKLLRICAPIFVCLAAAAFAADPCGDEYLAGYKLLQQKQFADARGHFEKALETAEKNWKKGACHYRIAECLEKEGDLGKAVEQYAQAASMKRTDRFTNELGRQRYIQDAIARLSEIAPKAGKGQVAREAIADLLESFPKISTRDRAQAYERAAALLVAEGKVSEAVAYLEGRILEDKYVTPQATAEMRLAAGKMLERAGKYEEAVAILAKAIATPGLEKRLTIDAALLRGEILIKRLGRIDEGRAQFEEVLDGADARRRSDLRLAIAESYEKGEQFEQARAAYESLIGDEKCQLGKRREAAEKLAKFLQRQGQYAEAKAFLLRAVKEQFPQPPEQQRLLRTLYDMARGGDAETAIQACDAIIALRHEDERTVANWQRDGLKRKAEILWGQRKRAEAVALLEEALKVEPGDQNQRLDLRLSIGQWQSEQGNHDAAHQQFDHVLQHADKDPWKTFRAYVRMSEAYRRESRYAEGRAAIEKALEAPGLRDDHRADLHNRMGELLKDDKKYDGAVEEYLKIKSLPEASVDWKARAIERAADLLRHQKKYEEAVKQLEAVEGSKLYRFGHQSTFLYSLAKICREAGWKDRAAEACRKLIALGANKHHIRVAKDWLKELEGKK